MDSIADVDTSLLRLIIGLGLAAPSLGEEVHASTLQFDVYMLVPYNQHVFAAPSPCLDASTRFCAVYGHPVQHSASPAMQNAGIAGLGLNWQYLAFDVHPDHLREAIAGAKAMKFIGLNLTVPHKLLALEMVDLLDESARKWGAVNTVRFDAEDSAGNWRPIGALPPASLKQVRSVGFNTDADAIVRSLADDLQIELEGTSVLVLGAGGAGSVAALKLAEAGANPLYLVNRTRAKAESLVREIKQRVPEAQVTVGFPPASVDLVVNATSLGLKPDDPLPVDASEWPLHRAGAVYDMIYRPAETPLLRLAKAAGCKVANGLGMLLFQGAKALEIWTEQAAPIELMKQALHRNVYGG